MKKSRGIKCSRVESLSGCVVMLGVSVLPTAAEVSAYISDIATEGYSVCALLTLQDQFQGTQVSRGDVQVSLVADGVGGALRELLQSSGGGVGEVVQLHLGDLILEQSRLCATTRDVDSSSHVISIMHPQVPSA